MSGSRTSNGSPPFSLLSAPFHILRIEPGATTQQVQLAFDQALEKQSVSADALAFARDVVLDPIRRLPHELGYPIDATPADIAAIYTALARDASPDECLAIASRLPPLSRANFLGHLAASQPATGASLSALLDAHASIEAAETFDILKALRTSAGYFAPSLVSVNQGLIDLCDNHARAAIARYECIQDAAQSVLTCTQETLAHGGRHHIEALGQLLAAYRDSIARQQAAANPSVETACEVLLRQPTDASSLQSLKAALHTWISIRRPLILWSADQRSAEPAVKLPVDQMRAVVASLAGQQQFEVALDLAEFGRDIFSVLPRTADQFDADVGLIADLLLQAKMQALRAFIEGLGDELSSLAISLVKSGFGPNSAGEVRALWNLFIQAADATVARPSTEPWMLARQLAIHLDQQMENEAACRLIRDLLAQGVEASVPPEILATLSDDLGVLEPQAKFDLLAKPAKRNARGLASLRIKPGRLVLLSGLALTAVLCVVDANVIFQMLWPPSSSVTAPEPISERSEPEIMPPIGAGQHLELAGVRYCKFQEARLLMIKPKVHEAEDTHKFNELVKDYNSRCSDFYYKDADLAAVEAEMAQNSPRLAEDAKRIVSAWQGHNFPAVAPAK
jgi:hypothetical protein